MKYKYKYRPFQNIKDKCSKFKYKYVFDPIIDIM